MFDALSIASLIAIFIGSATAIWVAGVELSYATDGLCNRLNLGQALGGVVVLAIVTNLPEIAITVSAAMSGSLGVAVGNILGGIAIQTVVLVLLDVASGRDVAPLTARAPSLTLVIEGLLVVAVLTVAIMGSQLPASLTAERLDPASVLIALLWVTGVWLVGRANEGLPWHAVTLATGDERPSAKESRDARKPMSIVEAWVVLAVTGAVTLAAGVFLERSGSAIAAHYGVSGVLFGATVLAAATALPEVSTGLTAMRIGDVELAVSDILGGNAFLPVLFLVATLVSGQAVLPHAQATDVYLAALGILLTLVYMAGLIFRPQRAVFGMGVDSLIVLILYAVGIAGLFAIAMPGAGQGAMSSAKVPMP